MFECVVTVGIEATSKDLDISSNWDSIDSILGDEKDVNSGSFSSGMYQSLGSNEHQSIFISYHIEYYTLNSRI